MKKVLWFTTSIFLFISFGIKAANSPRVVSLAPNLTEAIFSIDGGKYLVGRSTASNYFDPASDITVVGDFGIPSIEKLLLVKPDYVVASSLKQPSIKQTLQNMGVKLIILPTKHIEQYFNALDKLGKIMGLEKEAKKEKGRLKKGLNKFKKRNKKIPEKKKPKVFWVVSGSPLMTIGSESFINEYINYAGGKNIAKNESRGYFNISTEWVIYHSPEVIIAPNQGEKFLENLKSKSGWKDIPALKNNKVFTNLDSNLIYLLGPNMLEAIELLHNCIYNKKNDK